MFEQKMKRSIQFLVLLLIFASCSTKDDASSKTDRDFEISEFKTLTNFNIESDTLKLQLCLGDAVLKGITIPESGEYLHFEFQIRNTSKKPSKYYYKIYYQNQTYKHSEKIRLKGKYEYNLKSADNFYGSWEEKSIEYKVTSEIPNDGKFYSISDSFRIVGNPRNEVKYFGAEQQNICLSEREVEDIKKIIRNNENWYKKVIEKAEKNKRTIDQQLYVDAIWVIEDESKKGEENNRWKRNPRMGNYNFLLVVANEIEIGKIPYSQKNLCEMEMDYGAFLNPFYYFFKPETSERKGLITAVANEVLKVKANFKPENGLYVSPLKYKKNLTNSTFFNNYFGTSEKLFAKAHFEQFFHNINQNFPLKNIPTVEDVCGGNYSRDDYYKGLEKFEEKDLIVDYVKNTDNPGKTVGFDVGENALYLIVPGNEKEKHPKKENVGIKTRIGFTYGKFRAKVKFPDMINKDNVWNGLTYAVWLLAQDLAPWNNRSICSNNGYIPKHEVGKTDVREPVNAYSEIDIEIVKTAKHWPVTSYKDQSIIPKDKPAENHNLIFSCTNWDLACNEPSKFNTGVREIEWEKKKYHIHRWDGWYKALTIKTEVSHDETVGSIFCYEIDWQPDRIIWRIGPDKNNMQVVGYMDSTMTKIPDNQMIMVITQEFHDALWWPSAPFDQNYIPFPKNDIKAYVYDIEIE